MLLKVISLILILFSVSVSAQCEIKNSANVSKIYINSLRSICSNLSLDEKVLNKKFIIGVTDKFKNPNAFAIKDGGKQIILINPSMLELHSKNIQSISFVIAHEIAHFALDHVNDIKDSDLKDRLVASSLSTLSTAFGFAMGNFIDFMSATTAAQYSQKQELNADKFALEILLRNGYTKNDALYSMGILRDSSESSSFSDFLKTHPNPSLRLQNIQNTK